MTKLTDWLSEATEPRLIQHFGASTVARGQQYARLGRVGEIQTSGPLATAEVRGSGYRTYQTSVMCMSGFSTLVATCSCPMRADCKHAVALILTLQKPRTHRTTWQQILAPFAAAGPGSGRPLALQVSEEGATLVLRPMVKGVRGNWIRTGATWEELRRSGDFLPAHRDSLLAVLETRTASVANRPDGFPITDAHPAVWPALRRAVDAGVELVAGPSGSGRELPTPHLSQRPFVPTLKVSPGEDGALLLDPAIETPDGAVVIPGKSYLGRPAHGAALNGGDDLVLGPLSQPLDQAAQALFQNGRLSVPAAEVDEFASRFLPRLRSRVALEVGEGVDLPEPSPPQLVCRVEFREGSASLHWGFRYRMGQRSLDVGLAAGGDDRIARDGDAERELQRLVPAGAWKSGAELVPAFLTGRSLISFVSSALPLLRDRRDVVVELNAEPPAYREADEAPQVSLSVEDSERGDWFDLRVSVRVGEEVVPLADLMAALTAGDDHLLLDSGTWFPLDAPEFAELRQLIEEARLLTDHEGDVFQLRPEHAGLWEELVRLGVVTEQAEAWRESVGALLDPSQLPDEPVPAGLDATLRPYQETGFRWVRFLWRTRLGGILADEMGLGKTVQTLAAAQAAFEAGELDEPMLVVAPTSVIGTWAAEAARFVPDLKVVPVTATGSKRGSTLSEAIDGAQIVVTSYTLLRLEADQYQANKWSAVLLDEAQFVKNHASKAYHAVRALRARVKVALTGTPLENNVMDLWSLLSITSPGLFPNPKRFTTEYRRPIENGDAQTLARLRRRIRPLILRRTKSAVATELPEKQEQLVPVELSPGHRRLYERHLARERQKVLGLVGDLQRNRITILRSLTLLRQLSLSPALIEDDYPAASAKIDTLVELLDEVVAEGHRALVFSQFTGFLSLVRERFGREGIDYEYLDGRTRDRAARIEAFREGEAPVFLISLKAGGFGLTLTEADYVFILDPWWNPAAESQAIDRAHRIGQDKPVNVYRLVASDTIEEKVVELQQRKRDLFDSVVGTGSDTNAPLSADDILGLLSD